MIRRLLRSALLTLAFAGCSVPQWMPLIGENPVTDEPPKAAPPTSAVPVRLSFSGPKTAAPDERVTDRVLAIVNNDAITLSEIQEAIAVYRYENRDRATENSDQLVQQFLTRLIDRSRRPSGKRSSSKKRRSTRSWPTASRR